jgi:hypothetical protein
MFRTDSNRGSLVMQLRSPMTGFSYSDDFSKSTSSSFAFLYVGIYVNYSYIFLLFNRTHIFSIDSDLKYSNQSSHLLIEVEH